MARHDSALFRATAAWVMGETGDPRFTEAVAGLLREPNVVVRKRAFAALGSIRAAVAQIARGPARRLTARLLESDPGRRRIVLAVAGCPALLPTQIFVAEDGEPVLRYRVVERPLPETLSVVFLAPRTSQNPAVVCLPVQAPAGPLGLRLLRREERPLRRRRLVTLPLDVGSRRREPRADSACLGLPRSLGRPCRRRPPRGWRRQAPRDRLQQSRRTPGAHRRAPRRRDRRSSLRASRLRRARSRSRRILPRGRRPVPPRLRRRGGRRVSDPVRPLRSLVPSPESGRPRAEIRALGAETAVSISSPAPAGS